MRYEEILSLGSALERDYLLGGLRDNFGQSTGVRRGKSKSQVLHAGD